MPFMTVEMSKPPGARTLHCRTVARGRIQQVHHIRDLPVAASTTDHTSLSAHESEPNALEVLLSAFGSCLAAAIHANALVRHIAITSLSLDLSGDVDDSAHWGTSLEPKPFGFEAISVTVRIEADAPVEALAALVKHATIFSPVGNTLYNQVALKVALA